MMRDPPSAVKLPQSRRPVMQHTPSNEAGFVRKEGHLLCGGIYEIVSFRE